MSYLALSQRELSRFSHHWFWGLCVDKPAEDTFKDATVRLQSNPALLSNLENHIARISRQPSAIRALCWFFNWEQYRLHYYQLQAYTSWQVYQKGSLFFSNPDDTSPSLPNAFFINSFTFAAIWHGPRLQTYAARSLEWFSQRMAFFFPPLSELTASREVTGKQGRTATDAAPLTASWLIYLSPAEPLNAVTQRPIETEYFTVSAAMLNALRQLGLKKRVGETISFQELKTAYRKRCLETHPDKTGEDTDDEFKAVGTAYQVLFNLISSNAPGIETESSLLAKMIALQKEMDILIQELRDLSALVRGQTERIKRQTRVCEGLEADYEEMNRRVEAALIAKGITPPPRPRMLADTGTASARELHGFFPPLPGGTGLILPATLTPAAGRPRP